MDDSSTTPTSPICIWRFAHIDAAPHDLTERCGHRGDGWNEWKAVWRAITNKATLQRQDNCHVVASFYGVPFTGAYTLERARSNHANWGANVRSHHGNG